jgi:glycerol-3-phosphate dehydrogenase
MAAAVAAFCASGDDRALVSLPDFTEHEIRWLIAERAALTLDDLVSRRTQIALDGLAASAVLTELTSIIAATLDRNPAWAGAAVQDYLERRGVAGSAPAQLAGEHL